MVVSWHLFRSGMDGGWVKWKTTDAILYLRERGMIKSHGHSALLKSILSDTAYFLLPVRRFLGDERAEVNR